MKQYLLLAAWLLTLNLFSQQKQCDPCQIAKAKEVVRIDAILDESFWSEAFQISLDYETNPGNNLPAEVKTILRLAYDETNLYFAFEAHDPDPDKIRAIINDRDRLDDNDFVSLFLDPFNDSRRAFFFSINPLGVQQDGFYDAQTDNGNLTWDAIWNSSGRITSEGYVVEVAIPFKSLRFPSTTGIQTWRFFGMREYPRSVKKNFHSMPIDQDNNCLLCQANLIEGIAGVNPGRNLQLTPTFTMNRQDVRNEFPEGELEKGKTVTNVGFDAQWGITTDLTLNLTLNPDFSQVEADAAQLDVNNRFTLQFPEKRPFFLEGADFFDTPLQTFFSRTIADPSWGTKVTGKVKKNALGFLIARDQINNLILPGFQSSEGVSLEQEVTNVIGRYRRDFGDNANIGVSYTGREAENYHNRLLGMDLFYRPWKPVTIRAQYFQTQTMYNDTISSEYNQPVGNFSGDAVILRANYNTRNWNAQFIFQNRSKGVRTDAGFTPQVDFRNYRGWIERIIWPEKERWYQNFGFNTGAFRRQSTDGTLDIAGHWVSGFINGPLQLNYWINPDIVWQQFEGTTYSLTRLWTGFDIQPLGNLGINGWINLGPAVDFSNSRKADNLQFWLESDIRIGRHIDMTINHRHLHLHLAGDKILIANLTQWQAAYNFNPRLFFRMILQYRHTSRNPLLFEDDSVNEIDQSVFAQLLLSYKLNPQSVVFLGYVDNHQGNERSNVPSEMVPLTQLNQTLFFKVGYAWRP